MSQRNITIEYDQIALALGDLSSEGETIQLPEIAGSYLGNTNGFEYFPEVYYEFRAILDNYRALLCRDITMTSDMIGCFIAFDQQALTDYRNYNQNFSFNSPCPTPSQSSTQVLSASNLSSSEPSQYTFDASAVGTEDFYISMAEIEDMCTEIINNATTLMNSCDSYSTVIDNLVNTQGFLGQAAEALKNYWSNVHCACISKIYTAALTLADHVSAYWLNYNDSPALLASIPGGTFILQKCELDSARSILVDFDVGFEPLHTDVTTAISTASSSTSGAYDYSGYTPDYAALSEMVQANIGRIDAISNAVFGIEAGVIDSDRQLINDSISDLNDFINSVIANINEYNITNQEYGIPCSISSDYQDLAESVSTDLIEHQNYDDVLTEGVSRARNHAYQEALDDRRTQIEFEIATDIFMIAVSIASIFGTCGSDAPIAVSVIIANVDAISLCFASSDLVEDGQTYYYVQQGDLYTEGTNYMYEAYYEPLGLSREAYNNTERVFFFVTSVSCEVNGLSYANGNYGAGVARAFALEGAGELAGDAAYQIAIDCGASPMQAMLISMVAESGTSFGLESVWDEPGTPNAARIGSSDVDDISYGGSYHVDDVADDISDIRTPNTPDAEVPRSNIDVNDSATVHPVIDDTTPNTNVVSDVSDTTPNNHPVDSSMDTPSYPDTGVPDSYTPHNQLNIEDLDDYSVAPVVDNTTTNVVSNVETTDAADVSPAAHPVDTAFADGATVRISDSERAERLQRLTDNFDSLSNDELYNEISAILSDELDRYPLIDPDDVRTYVKGVEDGRLVLNWPNDNGGYILYTIESPYATFNGNNEIWISRVGENRFRNTIAIDEGEGRFASCSERGILNAGDIAYQGKLNADSYLELVDQITDAANNPAAFDMSDSIRLADGTEIPFNSEMDRIFKEQFGIVDSNTYPHMVWDSTLGQFETTMMDGASYRRLLQEEYYSFFTDSSMILPTEYNLANGGFGVNPRYGYMGTATAWGNLRGGATQANLVFSWESMQNMGLITDFHSIEVH